MYIEVLSQYAWNFSNAATKKLNKIIAVKKICLILHP